MFGALWWIFSESYLVDMCLELSGRYLVRATWWIFSESYLVDMLVDKLLYCRCGDILNTVVG